MHMEYMLHMLDDLGAVRSRLNSAVVHGKDHGLWTSGQLSFTVDLTVFRKYMSEALKDNPLFRFLVRIHFFALTLDPCMDPCRTQHGGVIPVY